MKKILLILLLIPSAVFGQLNLPFDDFQTTAEGQGYYYVMAGDDTLSQHIQEREAVAQGYNWLKNNKEADIDIVYNLRVHLSAGDPDPIHNLGIFSADNGDVWNVGIQFDTFADADSAWALAFCRSGETAGTFQEFDLSIQKGHVSIQKEFFCTNKLYLELFVRDGQGQVYERLESRYR